MLIKYSDLLDIEVIDNKEKFIDLSTAGILHGYILKEHTERNILGEKMLVRETTGKLLSNVNNKLKKEGIFIFVTCGYRSLKRQINRFQKRLQQICSKKFYPNPIDLYEEVHKSVAVPTVAGHPTGGAVDIILVDKNGDKLDMGAGIYDYRNDLYPTFAKGISNNAYNNRMILREAMMEMGFAPYDGEYRHFSYGDKEWALYYNKPNAIYNQIEMNQLKE